MNKVLNKKGFSLTDTLLSLVLMSSGLMGGMTVMQNASLNATRSEVNTIATQLTMSTVDEIIADNKAFGYEYITEDNYDDVDLGKGFDLYESSVTVIEVDPYNFDSETTNSSIKKVDVTVSWGREDHQQVTMSTLVAKI
jgi:Tfp pilus assembly protein PilV